MLFQGCATALLTPFCDGSIDYDAFAALLHRQVQAGCAALVVCGTTGESPTLSDGEQAALVRFAVRQVQGRVPVIAGCGSNSTQHACCLARGAQAAGADALLAVTPYYNRPSQRGLLGHYRALLGACELPLLLYNVPGRTGVHLQDDTVAQLAAHPRVAGLKDATGDCSRFLPLRSRCGGEFGLYSGDDAATLQALCLGGDGVISTVSNLAPRAMADLCLAHRRGDLPLARTLQRQLLGLIGAIFAEGNPVGLKYAAARMGLCRDELRLPLVRAGEQTRARIDAALEELHLI